MEAASAASREGSSLRIFPTERTTARRGQFSGRGAGIAATLVTSTFVVLFGESVPESLGPVITVVGVVTRRLGSVVDAGGAIEEPPVD